jgi:transcriptional regulator with XRE-family HTH domain
MSSGKIADTRKEVTVMATPAMPSARGRKLAGELHRLRRTAGLQGKDVADRLGWSPSKVSRIESGRVAVSPDDLELLIALYKVKDAEAQGLRERAMVARPKGWWDAYAGALEPWYVRMIELEANSPALLCYCALVPHALLQTMDYAGHVMRATAQEPPAAEIDLRMEVVRRRQDRLDPDGNDGLLQLTAVIDEAVLRRPVRGADGGIETGVMRGQLERLADVATRPNVTIHVLPFLAGLPPVTTGSFSILASPATGFPDVVYLEDKITTFFIDSEADVHRYAQEFQLLTDMAYRPGESLDLIKQTLAEL